MTDIEKYEDILKVLTYAQMDKSDKKGLRVRVLREMLKEEFNSVLVNRLKNK